MSEAETSAPSGLWATFWPIFITAMILPVLFEGFFITVGFYLRPTLVQWLQNLFPTTGQLAFLSQGYAQQLLSQILSVAGLVIDPFIYFLVFYWIGKRLNFTPSRYVGLFAYAFAGGLVGSLVSLGLAYGIYGFGNQPSILISANFILFVLPAAVRISMVAFIGVVLAYWRSSAPSNKPVEVASMPS